MATKAKNSKRVANEYEPKSLPAGTVVETIEKKGKYFLQITVPVDIRESSTGKSEIIATTGGNCMVEDLDYEGRPVYVGVVCYSPFGKDE